MSRSLIQARNSQHGLTGYGAHLVRSPLIAARVAWTSISHGLRGLRLPQVVKQVIVCSSSYFSNGGDTSASGSQRAGGGRGPNPGRQGAAAAAGGRGRGRTGDRPPAGELSGGQIALEIGDIGARGAASNRPPAGRSGPGCDCGRDRSPLPGRSPARQPHEGGSDHESRTPDDVSPARWGSAGEADRVRAGRSPSSEGLGAGVHSTRSAPFKANTSHEADAGDRWPGARDGGRSQTERGTGNQQRVIRSSSSSSDDPSDLRTAPDLPALAARVRDYTADWSRTRNVRTLVAAFNILAKFSTEPDADPALTRTTFKTLAVAYQPLVPGLRDAKSCVIPLWACAKLGYWEGGLAEELLRRLEEGGLLQGAKGQDHSLLWWSVSVVPPDMVDMAALAKKVLRVSGECLLRMTAEELESQHWSNVLLACARLQWGDDPALLHHVTTCLAAKPDIKTQDLANAIYSLGGLAEHCRHQPRPEDLQLLADEVVVRLLGQPGGQQIQRTGKGCARQPDVSRRGSFKPQELSNMLLGCAKLGYNDHPTLMQSLAIAASQAARRMTEQGLANSLYALAKLGWTDEVYTPDVQHLWSEVCQRLQSCPGGFKPQGLSNTLWALEELRPPAWEEHVGVLAEECRRRFTVFAPQALSNSVWALASMGWTQDQAWYVAAVAAAVRPGAMASANSQECSNLLYGLALVRHQPDAGLLQVMVAEGGERGCLATLRTSATSQACANLLWSLAVLGLYEQRLVDVLVERLGELLGRDPAQVTVQHLATSLWALVALNDADVLRRHSGLVEGLLREAVRRWAMQGGQLGTSLLPFKAEGLTQLWQVQLELMHTGLRGILQEAGGGSLLAAAQEARLESDRGTSRMERQVAGVLERLRRPLAEGQGASGATKWVRRECPVEGVCGRVDVVVEVADGRVVAVEVDGPWHFLANHPHTKDGSTQLRDRQLERVFGPGNVVSVPYWEWNEQRSDKQRQEYLCGLLGLQVP